MGYSKSPRTLRKIEQRLAPLLRKQSCKWFDQDPDDWAYKIRQGFYIAKLNPRLFPAIAEIADSYKIRVEGDIVYADYRVRSEAKLLSNEQDTPEPSAPKYVSYQCPDSIEKIITAWNTETQTNDKVILSFFDCPLDRSALERIGTWARGMGLQAVFYPDLTLYIQQPDHNVLSRYVL